MERQEGRDEKTAKPPTQPTTQSTLPSQSATHATYAAETIAGFGLSAPMIGLENRGHLAPLGESKVIRSKDKEMTEYKVEDENRDQREVQTPVGNDNSFACEWSGDYRSFGAGQEAFSGESVHYIVVARTVLGRRRNSPLPTTAEARR
ncbi:hypothetical protein KC19_VG197200 [Ceratodon purpureus]|uniref:Uncharacterized protein n=1 Tax=Ceratodon purpureus TaxID=3225 RepID=A0A8T0HRQ9_CERPU|nr:hypothetical protein KC19_VG197200 [Ceratodon purpureus]